MPCSSGSSFPLDSPFGEPCSFNHQPGFGSLSVVIPPPPSLFEFQSVWKFLNLRVVSPFTFLLAEGLNFTDNEKYL